MAAQRLKPGPKPLTLERHCVIIDSEDRHVCLFCKSWSLKSYSATRTREHILGNKCEYREGDNPVLDPIWRSVRQQMLARVDQAGLARGEGVGLPGCADGAIERVPAELPRKCNSQPVWAWAFDNQQPQQQAKAKLAISQPSPDAALSGKVRLGSLSSDTCVPKQQAHDQVGAVGTGQQHRAQPSQPRSVPSIRPPAEDPQADFRSALGSFCPAVQELARAGLLAQQQALQEDASMRGMQVSDESSDDSSDESLPGRLKAPRPPLTTTPKAVLDLLDSLPPSDCQEILDDQCAEAVLRAELAKLAHDEAFMSAHEQAYAHGSVPRAIPCMGSAPVKAKLSRMEGSWETVISRVSAMSITTSTATRSMNCSGHFSAPLISGGFSPTGYRQHSQECAGHWSLERHAASAPVHSAGQGNFVLGRADSIYVSDEIQDGCPLIRIAVLYRTGLLEASSERFSSGRFQSTVNFTYDALKSKPEEIEDDIIHRFLVSQSMIEKCAADIKECFARHERCWAERRHASGIPRSRPVAMK